MLLVIGEAVGVEAIADGRVFRLLLFVLVVLLLSINVLTN